MQLLAKTHGLDDWRQMRQLKAVQERLRKSLAQMAALVRAELKPDAYARAELCSLLGVEDAAFASEFLTPNTQHGSVHLPLATCHFPLHTRCPQTDLELRFAFPVPSPQSVCFDSSRSLDRLLLPAVFVTINICICTAVTVYSAVHYRTVRSISVYVVLCSLVESFKLHDRALHVYEEAARVDEFERICIALHEHQSAAPEAAHEAIAKLGMPLCS